MIVEKSVPKTGRQQSRLEMRISKIIIGSSAVKSSFTFAGH